jgi:3-dehydroquinate dehydratase / shikimate dehydrogenase
MASSRDALTVVATLTGARTPPPDPRVRYAEVRADLGGDIDPAPLRTAFPGGLLYTLRSADEGGSCADPPQVRHRRLLAAADHYDFVDLEAARDLSAKVLERVPPERRVLTWQGPATDLDGLRRRLDTLTGVGARLYRLAPYARTQEQALVPLRLLRSLARRDVTAYARGAAGTWTRVLAARFGAPMAFGWLGDTAADGELPLHRLLADYPYELIVGAERLYGIIGGSTGRSLSPLVHNTAYRSLGLRALFLPFTTEELPCSLAVLGDGLHELGLPLQGVTSVAPHKEAALALAAEATPLARRVGKTSLLVRRPSGWWADNEADGVVAALAGRIDVEGRRIAVIGCGGAGQAAAAGLSEAGAEVTLVNRGRDRGEYAAERLGLPFTRLDGFDPRPFSVLIHATPVTDALLFSIADLDPAAVVFDLNYGPTDTPLVAAARAAGHVTLDGRDMLVAELSRQFRLMTGHEMPIGEVRAALGIAG